jgi:uroporphyrinogen-III synthase
MPQSWRGLLQSLRDVLTSASPFIVAGIALVWLAYWWLNPTPPHHIRLATGPSQSAYAEFGQRYAKLLAANGIEVELIPSEGSSANLQLLQEGRADLGFVQGGSGAIDPETELLTLGNLFVEPIWIFYRDAAAWRITPRGRLTSMTQLQTLRVNVGHAGSGVPLLMASLLENNGLEPSRMKLSQLEQTPATVALLNGELDAVAFASAPEAAIVQMLLQTPGIHLLDFAQHEAYARRLPFVTPVVLPRGIVNLARDIPPQNTRLIATTTSLLARESVHPALLQLFSQATLSVHGQGGWFSKPREYPNISAVQYPVAAEAERTLRNGIPTLQRYLPFSWANLLERMGLAMGLIIAILLPLAKIAPPLYAFRVRSRVFRWYGELRELEERYETDRTDTAGLLAALQAMENKVEKIIVPLSYADELYALRNHIELVRQRMFKG